MKLLEKEERRLLKKIVRNLLPLLKIFKIKNKMKLDKTKVMAIVVFVLTIIKMVHDFKVTGEINFTNSDTLSNGIIALTAIITGYTHDEEVAVALATPVDGILLKQFEQKSGVQDSEI